MELVNAPVHVIGTKNHGQDKDGKPVIVCRGIIRILEKKEYRQVRFAAYSDLTENKY